MIISDKYEYVFIELPRTGTTAISKELIANYGGKKILDKHSSYRDFLKIATPKQKKYFVFSCVRNPIDREVSFYIKCTSGFYDFIFNQNYKKNIYDRFYLLKRVKYAKKDNSTFDSYLKKFHFWPYVDWSCMDHDNFNYIIRFENLNNDFKVALKKIGIDVKRDLPKINVTGEKKNYLEYLNHDNINLYINTFGPAVKLMGYKLIHLEKFKIPKIIWMKYKTIKTIKSIYWKYLKYLGN